MFGRMLAGKPKDEKSPVPGRIIKYEIMVHYDKHWVIDCIMDDEEQAIMHARALLTDEKNDEVKVIRQRSMAATGFTTEKPVFEQVRPPKKKEIGLSATINAAPPCEKLEDLFSLDARVLMNRLFREFLDSLVITPTELLHNYGYFKKLDNIGSLISSAVYQVAQAQANAGLGTAKDRANVVHGLIAQATTLARDALVERKRLPPFEPESLAEFCRRVQARVEPHEWRYMVMMTLANHLAGSRNWGQKLEQIVALMG
ncbi:MAG: hypothetical protein HY057_01910, partial [Rhodospirillales bacterium]|nr:hypothetical protein [Rhodospirillales bacterium]